MRVGRWVAAFILAGLTWSAPAGAAGPAPRGQAEEQALAAQVLAAQARALDAASLDARLQDLNRDTRGYLPSLDRDTAVRILRGEEHPWTLRQLAEGLARYLFDEVAASLGLLARLVALGVLAAVLSNLQSSFAEAQVARAAYAVVLVALAGMALAAFKVAMDAASGAVERLVGFMQAALPPLITLLAASGSVVTAGLLHPLVLAGVQLSSLLILKWVFPLLFLAAVVETVTGFSEEFRLTGVARLLRQAGMLVLGLGFCLFLGVLTVYGVGASVADGVTLRSAKFMAKAFVPVVGGMFADAAELVASASLLLRNGVGLVGLLAVLFTVAFPVLKLVALILIYRLAGVAVQPVAGPGVAACLEGLAGSLTLVAVAVGAVAVMFVLALGVLVAAGNAAVMFR